MISGSNHDSSAISSHHGLVPSRSRSLRNSFRNRIALIALASMAWASVAQAKLVFDRTEVDVAVEAGASEVWIEFPFTNEGATAVTVDEISASCGCTVPELAKKKYAAGEQGVLRAQFNVGERQGMQSKQITVQAGGETIALKFNADIPARSQFSPRLLLFRGDNIAPRSTILSFTADTPVVVLSVISHNPAYEVELIPLVEGEKYEIKVSLPAQPDADVKGTLRVQSEGASGREYNDLFFARYLP